MARTRKRRVSFGIKMYLFVLLTVFVVALGTSLVSYYINANQIDTYFKGLTLQSARNVASFVDGDYLEKLRAAAESEEYQALREKAEEDEDEAPVEAFLREKGLWDKYVEQREYLIKYLENMTDIKYLYIVACGDKNATLDMYLVDGDLEVGIYETGYYEEREESLMGMDASQEVEPTISIGDWGWLCSGFAPVKNSAGEVVCQVGCDVGMDDVMSQRHTLHLYIILGAIAVVVLVLGIAVLFARRVVINPLNRITREMENFKPEPNISNEEAGVINLDIRSRDEIYDLYQGVQTMQTDIMYQLNDLTLMRSDKEKRDAELAIASGMQKDMLPKDFRIRDEFALFASMTPAKEMGGDFYDFFIIDDDHVGIVMADVSGKGVPAAMFMIVAKTLLKIRTKTPGTPAQILKDVNNTLCADNPSELFVTVWFAILTLSTGELVSSNAGHEYPALMRNGSEYVLLRGDNMPPLATVEDLEYVDETITLLPGDRLFLYTDGVPEAKRGDGERFGLERMLYVLHQYRLASPENLLKYMESEIVDFTGDQDLFDDITMMSIIWKGKQDT